MILNMVSPKFVSLIDVFSFYLLMCVNFKKSMILYVDFLKVVGDAANTHWHFFFPFFGA